MLKKLYIKNYALIDEVEIDFSDGLSIITGETGAGKSIMLGALGLLLGGRADTKAISDKEHKTVVEAVFRSQDGREVIIRRELSPNGRSRAFVDDSPVTVVQLQNLTLRLLDIHSQHANLSLNSREGQLGIIDAMAANGRLLDDNRKDFRRYVEIRSALKKIKEQRQKNAEKRSFIQYQLDGLKKLNPRRGEHAEIERRYEVMSEADEIRENLTAAHYVLSSDRDGVLSGIQNAIEALESFNLQTVDPTPEDESLIARLKSIYIEVKDIAYTAEQLADSIESNPHQLAKLSQRMHAYYEAVRAMGVDNGDDLVDLKEDLEQQLYAIDGDDDETKELEAEGRQLARSLKEQAEVLSRRRKEAGEEFSRRLTERAMPLGLPNLKFAVEVSKGKLTSDGQDNVEFICSFNKNGALHPMASVASGGELSRLTLTIKSLMAEHMNMPTIIFDEIDTGVSGEIADKMGRMMLEMSRSIQIITITHLPQVAAKGYRHYKVYKHDTDVRTVSSVRELTDRERIEEIAAMLSGESLTDAAVKAAKALLKSK